jgi:hypothetical protein
MKQVVNHLVVGVEPVPHSWSKEVNWMNISFVHRNVPKDLALSKEERYHPPLPHLVVFAIKVRRTRTPFPVHHLRILDWLESMKTRTSFDTTPRTELATREGE